MLLRADPRHEERLDDVVPARHDRQRSTARASRSSPGRSTRPTRPAARRGRCRRSRDLIGLPINYLITVNFRGFKQIVNRLGGVWIDVDRRYFNNNAGLSPTFGYAKINLQPGYQLLTGGSALDYVRFRHTDSDLFRVARQQQFVKAMKYQLAHNFSIAKVPKIIGALTKNIEVGAGGGRERLRQDGPQLRVLRLPPAVGPLLPVADPGPDRLLRPAHRPVEHPGRGAGLAPTRTSRRPRSRPPSRSAGRCGRPRRRPRRRRSPS